MSLASVMFAFVSLVKTTPTRPGLEPGTGVPKTPVLPITPPGYKSSPLATTKAHWTGRQSVSMAHKAKKAQRLFIFRIAAAVCPRNLNRLPRPWPVHSRSTKTRSPRRSIRTENYPSDEELYRRSRRLSMVLQKILPFPVLRTGMSLFECCRGAHLVYRCHNAFL